MRHGTTNRRQRNRSNNGRRSNQPQRTQVYDSNGPDVRIRGTAHQVAEKYLALAKDLSSAGDRILAESYYQHAEHYIRIINEMNGTFDMSRLSDDRVSGNGFDEEEVIVTPHVATAAAAVATQSQTDLGLPASILGSSVSRKETEVAD